MRRVSVKTGANLRVNEILGESITNDATGELTAWSIQSAMLENMRRIVRAMNVNDINGTKMFGLYAEADTPNIDIEDGIAFTKGGDVIVVEAPISYEVQDLSNGDKWLYLKHVLSEDDGSDSNAGKETTFVDKRPPEEIVADDLASLKKSNVSNEDVVNAIIELTTTESPQKDRICIAKINVLDNVVTVVEQSGY